MDYRIVLHSYSKPQDFRRHISRELASKILFTALGLPGREVLSGNGGAPKLSTTFFKVDKKVFKNNHASWNVVIKVLAIVGETRLDMAESSTQAFNGQSFLTRD